MDPENTTPAEGMPEAAPAEKKPEGEVMPEAPAADEAAA